MLSILACPNPIEMISSDNFYFASVTADRTTYGQPPFPTLFNLTRATMTFQFLTYQEVIIEECRDLHTNAHYFISFDRRQPSLQSLFLILRNHK